MIEKMRRERKRGESIYKIKDNMTVDIKKLVIQK